MEDKVKILDTGAVKARLKRIAFEVYEANYQENELVVIGIDERGGFVSDYLCNYLETVSDLKLLRVNASLDRSTEMGGIGIELDIDIEELKNKPVLVVDDVLYTGNTMLNIAAILLQASPQNIQISVLIDRGHRSMPVSPDYVGLELSTTIHQHVSVEISSESVEAFLL